MFAYACVRVTCFLKACEKCLSLSFTMGHVNICLLGQEQAGIVVDKHGSPTGPALTLPPGVPGLASSGLYVVAACADGVHIYDRTTSAWAQSLPYPGGMRAAPGQQLLVAQNVKGSCVLVAGYRKVRIRHLSRVKGSNPSAFVWQV